MDRRDCALDDSDDCEQESLWIDADNRTIPEKRAGRSFERLKNFAPQDWRVTC